MDIPQKMAMFILLCGTIVAIGYFTGKATEPNWTLLYSDLTESDAIAVTAHLKEAGYAYKISDDKTSVFVSSALKEQLRIEIAENDIIQDSNPGFELLDQVNFGATDFHNKLTKQRIYQGEITRTIERINGVRKARVQIAEPDRSVFSDRDESPSASVMLILESGHKLKSAQIRAIKNLVAYAVPRLKPEKVFLTDQKGRALSGDMSRNSNDIASYRSSFEAETARKIEKVLEKIVGKDNVSVEVSAKMNFDSAKATIERYIPMGDNKSVMASSHEEKEIYDTGTQKKSDDEEAESADNNPAPEAPESEEDKKKMNYSKTRTSNNYNVSKEVRQVVYAPGKLQRMTIAVALNKVLTSKEKQELTNLVMTASGADMTRGDIINITSMQFAPMSETEKMAEKILEEVEKQNMVNFIVSKVTPFLVVLILGLVALITINNIIKKPLEGYEMIGEGGKYRNQIGLDDEIAGLIDVEMPSAIESSLDPQLEKMKTEINDMVLSDPQEAARLLLTFIKD